MIGSTNKHSAPSVALPPSGPRSFAKLPSSSLRGIFQRQCSTRRRFKGGGGASPSAPHFNSELLRWAGGSSCGCGQSVLQAKNAGPQSFGLAHSSHAMRIAYGRRPPPQSRLCRGDMRERIYGHRVYRSVRVRTRCSGRFKSGALRQRGSTRTRNQSWRSTLRY